MAVKLFNLIALSSLAIIACSFGASPANALSVESSPNHARHFGHHQPIALKKRADTRRCKPRPSSSSAKPPATQTPVRQDQAAPKPTSSPQPASTPAASTPPPSSGKGKVGLAWANGDDAALKNFVTSKVSTYDFFPPISFEFPPTSFSVFILGVHGNLLDLMPLVWNSRLCSGEPSKLPISNVS